MAKTIQDQITEMENRCAQLEGLQKLFEKAIKNEFGIDAKKIHQILKSGSVKASAFEKKISSYFALKTSQDFNNFLSVFCTEECLNYYNKKCTEDNVPGTE